MRFTEMQNSFQILSYKKGPPIKGSLFHENNKNKGNTDFDQIASAPL